MVFGLPANAPQRLSVIHGVTSQISFRRIFAFVGGAFAVTYFLFQKKLLPPNVAKVVSKVLFYPTFPITAALRIGQYWTKVDDTLICGCAPFALLNHPIKLRNLGVTGVVNMCYEYPGPVEQYKKLGITQLHLPVVDHTEPSPEVLQDAVNFIREHKKRGEKVYVHCKAGHGRAASVALAWMMSESRDKSPLVSCFHFCFGF
jgi:atypical dual specificity phosphatase